MFPPVQKHDIYAVADLKRLERFCWQCTPGTVWSLGNLELLKLQKIALFCSEKCPGDRLLPTFDLAAEWRDGGRCVISGFHSPVEKGCWEILLRGRQPLILCPARSIENMRIPSLWRALIEAGRLLVLSPFPAEKSRKIKLLAEQRNRLVAVLADEHHFVYVTPGGSLERLKSEFVKNESNKEESEEK